MYLQNISFIYFGL